MTDPGETHTDVALVARKLNRSRFVKGLLGMSLVALGLGALVYQFAASQPKLEPIDGTLAQELRRGLTAVKGQPARAQRYAIDGLLELERYRYPPHLLRALEVVRPIELGGELRCREALEVPKVLDEFATYCDDPHAALSGQGGGVKAACNATGMRNPFPGWYGSGGASEHCYILAITLWGYVEQRNSGFDFEQRMLYQMVTGDVLYR